MNITEGSAKVPMIMDAGKLEPWVYAFADGFAALKYAPLSIRGYTDSARHFAAWLAVENISLDDINVSTLGHFARHSCRCGGYRREMPFSKRYMQRVRRFVVFLAEHGAVVPLGETTANSLHPMVWDFQQWLVRHRGIRVRTAARHGQMIMRLLPLLGTDPRVYDAASIRMAVLKNAQGYSIASTKTVMTALRGYLRFLAASELCRHGLEHAVPRVPEWRLSSLPRYLSPEQVDQIIASCDCRSNRSIRDQAILLLLVRFGLRAGDISDMRLGDFDWVSGTLRVRGKGRYETLLPLPQDAGDAVIAYLDTARPTVDDDHVFLSSRAPFQPFRRSSCVSNVVNEAIKRAGIHDAPAGGANLLRHTTATCMLRSGATLQSIGAVLRHKSLEITGLYAKVDLNMLKQIAQRWPGEVPHAD